MSPTVYGLRNAIRVTTNRFEREVQASFTKEELQAICERLGLDIDEAGHPSTSRMRRFTQTQVGIEESLEAADDAIFRKADRQSIAKGVGASSDP